MERLSRYEFEDKDAEEKFKELMEELSNIRSLEDFQRRYGDLFNGPKSLSYQEALDLMRQMEQLKEMEESLLSGNMQNVDPEELKELMGQGAWQDFDNLQQMRAMLDEAGLVIQKEGRLKLSPKGVRRIGQLALRDIYQNLFRDRAGSHFADHRGIAEVRIETTKPYHYGDPMHLDLVGTLKQSLMRGAGVPLSLEPGDFLVFDSDHTTTTSTVLLLDMSWSMSWEGRFAAAKKVALALENLIRTRYPRDYLGIVGFFTRAVELKVKDLPEASWNMGDPFTNLQDGSAGLTILCRAERQLPRLCPQPGPLLSPRPAIASTRADMPQEVHAPAIDVRRQSTPDNYGSAPPWAVLGMWHCPTPQYDSSNRLVPY